METVAVGSLEEPIASGIEEKYLGKQTKVPDFAPQEKKGEIVGAWWSLCLLG